MKSQSLIFPFVALLLTPHLHAQSRFLDSLKQLQDQRNKALAVASEPINRNYAASLKQLLQSATQAADLDSAVKIKEELKPFEKGPVSLLGLPVKESKVAAGQLVLGGTTFLEGKGIVVDGKPCTEWLGAHAPSRIVYAIPPGINTFTAIGVAPTGISGDWLYIIKFNVYSIHLACV